MKRDYMYISQSSYEVIDNFLPQKEFQEIQSSIMNNYSSPYWVYTPNVSGIGDGDISDNWKYFYMTHVVYNHGMNSSPLFEKMIPILKELDVKALIRIKCNMYPNSEKVHVHEMHCDEPFSHNGAIFSINTCNGYTKLEDGQTKIDSVANRVLLFDPSKPHCSTTTSDTTVRMNINFNYF